MPGGRSRRAFARDVVLALVLLFAVSRSVLAAGGVGQAACCAVRASPEPSGLIAEAQAALERAGELIAMLRALPADTVWSDLPPTQTDSRTIARVRMLGGGVALLGLFGCVAGFLSARAEARDARAALRRLAEPSSVSRRLIHAPPRRARPAGLLLASVARPRSRPARIVSD